MGDGKVTAAAELITAARANLENRGALSLEARFTLAREACNYEELVILLEKITDAFEDEDALPDDRVEKVRRLLGLPAWE